MQDQNTNFVSFKAGFFMLIAFAIGGFLLSGLLSMPIIMLMTGNSFSNIAELMANPANYRISQVVQSVASLFGMLIPTLFVASRLSKQPLQLTGFKGDISLRQLWLVMLISFTGMALSGSLGYLSYQLPFPVQWRKYFDGLEIDYMEQAANLINLSNVGELLLSIVVLGFLPALCEEVLFRGGLQNYLYKSSHRKWFSIILVSLIFSLIHFSFYGFLSRFLLGMVLGLIYHDTGRIWLNILMHFINNTAAVLFMYFQQEKGKSMVEIMSDKEGNYWGFVALPFLILFLYRLSQTKPQTTNHGI